MARLANREIPLIPADRTPYVIRTGDEVRVSPVAAPSLVGQFVGYGLDSVSSTPLLFVQIGTGVAAFPVATTQLQPKES